MDARWQGWFSHKISPVFLLRGDSSIPDFAFVIFTSLRQSFLQGARAIFISHLGTPKSANLGHSASCVNVAVVIHTSDELMIYTSGLCYAK